ncbi:MAG: hypothetical protein V1875_03105 [Candidatus Altiarchaeota archaeon]
MSRNSASLVIAALSAFFVFFGSGLAFAEDSDDTPSTGCLASVPGKALNAVKGGSTTTTLFCQEPYIQVGDSCCLDRDGSGVCDSEEYAPADEQAPEEEEQLGEEPTTTTEPTATTEPPTTPTAPVPTTTQASIACVKNSDCGQEVIENVCKDGDVYRQQTNPLCNSPGTVRAECKMKVKLVGQTMTQPAVPSERCANGCRDGACI